LAAPGLLSFIRQLTGNPPSGSLAVLNAGSLVEELYAASLKAEEGHRIKCLITCLHARGARPVDFIEWKPSQLSARAVAKIATATDPRGSSLVVKCDAHDQWWIVGIIARLPAAPVGAFQISVEGVAHLSLRLNGKKEAEYIGGEVETEAADILRIDPVKSKLGWTNSQVLLVAELLQRMDSQGHGGAVLVDDDAHDATAPLSITYSIAGAPYSGLLEHSASRTHSKGRDRALWVATSLSRVDGAVVMNRKLEILGNGARLGATPATSVRVASRSDGKHARSVTGLGRWGTRHGSMISYCQARPKAVGFVVSEDGGVRAISHLGGTEATIWERIRLGEDDLPARVP
jgi:hypothetical protein